jgi:hypothetical protein
MFTPEIVKRSLIRATLVTVLVVGYLLLTEEKPTSNKPTAETEVQVLDKTNSNPAQPDQTSGLK